MPNRCAREKDYVDATKEKFRSRRQFIYSNRQLQRIANENPVALLFGRKTHKREFDEKTDEASWAGVY